LRAAKFFLILFLTLLPVLLNARPASAQALSGIELENVVALVDFGKQITFAATVKSSVPIQGASIIVEDVIQGTSQIEPLLLHEDGRTEFRFDTRQNILRPFSPLKWHYRFTLADGTFQTSDEYSVHYDDTRFQWQSLESGMLRVHWYAGGQDFGQAALNTARAGVDSVKHLIPAPLDQPVDFYIYASLSDLRGTLISGSQEWVAGHADPSLGVVMVAVEPGPAQEDTMQQRIPHELMHVMLYRAVGDGYRTIPAWLSEGTAGLAEIVTNAGYGPVLKQAVARSDWIPLGTVCSSFPEDSDRAFLAYAEARSFAHYLHEKYGSTRLLELATLYASGADCVQGPELAFGLPLSVLEEDWHASLVEQKGFPTSLKNITPYLVLLGVILIFPIFSILSSIRRKGNAHGPETYIRK
jgi:hypothetical protein